jgi:hypothetical protein
MSSVNAHSKVIADVSVPPTIISYNKKNNEIILIEKNS